MTQFVFHRFSHMWYQNYYVITALPRISFLIFAVIIIIIIIIVAFQLTLQHVARFHWQCDTLYTGLYRTSYEIWRMHIQCTYMNFERTELQRGSKAFGILNTITVVPLFHIPHSTFHNYKHSSWYDSFIVYIAFDWLFNFAFYCVVNRRWSMLFVW